MENLKEEQFKSTLMSVISDFGKKGLTIGMQYYILKDVYNEVSNIYQQYIQQQLQQEQTKEDIEDNE